VLKLIPYRRGRRHNFRPKSTTHDDNPSIMSTAKYNQPEGSTKHQGWSYCGTDKLATVTDKHAWHRIQYKDNQYFVSQRLFVFVYYHTYWLFPAHFCPFSAHPGTLTLRAERQSARMSKITNDGLTRPGTGCFITVPMATVGIKGLMFVVFLFPELWRTKKDDVSNRTQCMLWFCIWRVESAWRH